MTIVPNPNATHGWTVLLADPGLALSILVDGSLQVPRYGDYGITAPVTLSTLLASETSYPNDGNTTIEQYNAAGGVVQTALDALESRIIQEFGLVDSEDLVHAPVLFDAVEEYTGGPSKALAITPGLVNGCVYGNTFIAPDPFLHEPAEQNANSSGRLDASEGAGGISALDTAADPFQAWFSSNMPAGVSVQYIDDWFLYHMLAGEVHCSSNDKRTIPSGPKWWESVP